MLRPLTDNPDDTTEKEELLFDLNSQNLGGRWRAMPERDEDWDTMPVPISSLWADLKYQNARARGTEAPEQ